MLSSSLGTTRILKEVTLGKIRVVLYDSGLKTSPFLHLEAVLNVLQKGTNLTIRGSSQESFRKVLKAEVPHLNETIGIPINFSSDLNMGRRPEAQIL